MGCLICRKEAEPHHLDAIGMGRNRKKELKEHYTAIPLCRVHHGEYHQYARSWFEKKYNIILWKECFKLFRHYVLGEDIKIEPRTDRQNKYYWAKVIATLSTEFGYTRAEVHDLLKKMFGVKSTSELSSNGMSEYIEQCIAFAAEQDIVIPE